MNERFNELWNDYLEGDLDASRQDELQALVDGDPTLQLWAVDLFQTHRLLGFAHQSGDGSFVRELLSRLPKSDGDFVNAVTRSVPVPQPRSRPFGQVLAGLLCGLLLGALATSAAWAYARPREPRVDVLSLLDDSFESSPAPRPHGIPLQADLWSGDLSEVVGEQQGVSPSTGRRMLRVLRADTEQRPNDAGYVADLYRVVDVRAHRELLQSGAAVAQLSAAFNAASFPESEKYQCSVFLYAFDGLPNSDVSVASNGLQDEALAFTRSARLLLDRVPGAWQFVSAELRLPATTDYVLIRLGVVHGLPGQRRPDFPGHYLDDVRLVLTRRAPL